MENFDELKQMNRVINQAAASESQGEVKSYPSHITLMPLTRCNYKCRMCGEWKKGDKPELPWETIKKLEPVLPFVQSMFITGGEPFMYRHLGELLAMGRRAEVNLSLVSNGSLFGAAQRDLVLRNGLSHIKFSLDAATSKTYAKIRGGNLLKVLSNIANLSLDKLKQGTVFPEIQLGFVAMRSNIAELAELVQICSEIGVKSVFVTYCQINCPEMVPESLYLHQEYSDEHMRRGAAAAEEFGVRLELPPLFDGSDEADDAVSHCSRLSEVCQEPWRNLFIRADGTCSMCCGGGAHAGNLNEMSFKEVWNHPRRVATRKIVNTDHPPKECRACRTLKQDSQNPDTHFIDNDLIQAAETMRTRRQERAAAVNE